MVGWRYQRDPRDRGPKSKATAKMPLPVLLPAQSCAQGCPCLGVYDVCRCAHPQGPRS